MKDTEHDPDAPDPEQVERVRARLAALAPKAPADVTARNAAKVAAAMKRQGNTLRD